VNITIETVMATNPCYTVEQVTELFAKGATLDTLLSIPQNDARWILSKLLTTPNAVIWAKACAARAASYASNTASHARDAAGYASYTASSASYDASYARDAAGYASYTASYARHAASYACYAYYASFAAGYASNAEHELACEHALELIRKQR